MAGDKKPIPEGKRYGSLVVQKRPLKNPLKYHQNLCKCDCGRTVIVSTYMLSTGKTTECGCMKRSGEVNSLYPERIKGLDDLANAIVQKAADDYRQAVMAFLKSGDNGNLTILRRFFRSGWYSVLTELDAEVLMNRIEQECIIEFERKKKHGN